MRINPLPVLICGGSGALAIAAFRGGNIGLGIVCTLIAALLAIGIASTRLSQF